MGNDTLLSAVGQHLSILRQSQVEVRQALASGLFTPLGNGHYKQASIDTKDEGKIWVKKEFTDPKTGAKEEWLVVYGDDKNEFIRQASLNTTAMPTPAAKQLHQEQAMHELATTDRVNLGKYTIYVDKRLIPNTNKLSYQIVVQDNTTQEWVSRIGGFLSAVGYSVEEVPDQASANWTESKYAGYIASQLRSLIYACVHNAVDTRAVTNKSASIHRAINGRFVKLAMQKKSNIEEAEDYAKELVRDKDQKRMTNTQILNKLKRDFALTDEEAYMILRRVVLPDTEHDSVKVLASQQSKFVNTVLKRLKELVAEGDPDDEYKPVVNKQTAEIVAGWLNSNETTLEDLESYSEDDWFECYGETLNYLYCEHVKGEDKVPIEDIYSVAPALRFIDAAKEKTSSQQSKKDNFLAINKLLEDSISWKLAVGDIGEPWEMDVYINDIPEERLVELINQGEQLLNKQDED